MYQSLARFIRWSDDILLHGDKALNKDNANEVIRALSDGVKVSDNFHPFLRDTYCNSSKKVL